MRKRVIILQHVPFEGPGTIADWSRLRGHEQRNVRLHDGDELPAPTDADLLVVMGGPMSVHDTERFSWLAAEIRFVREAIEAGTRILGICLGAQIVAVALGATVSRNREAEIGWFPVRMTAEGRHHPLFPDGVPGTAFHWHGESFSIPDGCVRVAESDGCDNQGFVSGDRVVGLQFHLETDDRTLAALVKNSTGDLVPGRYVMTPDEMKHGLMVHGEEIRSGMLGLLDRLVAVASESVQSNVTGGE